MPAEPVVQTNQNVPPAGAPPPSTPPSSPPIQEAQPESTAPPPVVQQLPAGGKTISVNSRDYAEFRKAAEAKAERKAAQKLDSDAKELGFKDHADLVAYTKDQKQKASQPRTSQNPPRVPAGVGTVPEKKFRELSDLFESEKRTRISLQGRVKELQNRLEEQAAEFELRGLAKDAGAVDPEFVVHLIRGRMTDATRGLTDQAAIEAAIAQIDEGKIIAELKTSRPVLFTAGAPDIRPANTGPGSHGAPPPGPPGPGEVRKNGANNQIVDATQMSDAEWQKYKREHHYT